VGAHPTMVEITRYAMEKSDAVTAVSKSLAMDTEQIFHITPGKVKVLYNFINPKNFNPSLKSVTEGQEPKEKTIIIHLSNLRAVKRPLDVIRIYYQIYKKISRPVELHVIGEGPMQYEMMILAEKMGIEHSVKFLGARSDIGTVIASSDLMLLPSQNESFGMAALEAMACQVPVVASRVGGLVEVIEDGRSGFLHAIGDIDEAAEKAVNVLENTKLYDSIITEALKVALVKFSMEDIINQYERIYKDGK
ncbi:MAG: glycosyltransferase, partial [bacterium]